MNESYVTDEDLRVHKVHHALQPPRQSVTITLILFLLFTTIIVLSWVGYRLLESERQRITAIDATVGAFHQQFAEERSVRTENNANTLSSIRDTRQQMLALTEQVTQQLDEFNVAMNTRIAQITQNDIAVNRQIAGENRDNILELQKISRRLGEDLSTFATAANTMLNTEIEQTQALLVDALDTLDQQFNTRTDTLDSQHRQIAEVLGDTRENLQQYHDRITALNIELQEIKTALVGYDTLPEIREDLDKARQQTTQLVLQLRRLETDYQVRFSALEESLKQFESFERP